MSTPPSLTPQPPPGGPPAAPPAKSSNVFFWIIGGFLAFVFICVLAVGAFFFFIAHKAKQAGFDPELMRKNPGMAMAKLFVSAHPDVDLVSSNESTGTIVIRDKKDGKLTTMRFDSQKNTMVVIDDKGNQAAVKISGDGSTGAVEITGSGPDGSGTVKIGTNADKPPDWVPVYPGSTPQSNFSVTGTGDRSGTYVFVTKDATEKVLSYYADALKSGGLTASTTTSNTDGKVSGIVTGSVKDEKRTVMVTAGPDEDGTHVNVVFTEKK